MNDAVRVVLAAADPGQRLLQAQWIACLKPRWSIVASVGSAADALAAVDAERPDLVIGDARLPFPMRGSWLDRLPPSLPTIFTVSERRQAVHAFARPMLGGLLLPIAPRRLRATLMAAQAVIDRARSTGERPDGGERWWVTVEHQGGEAWPVPARELVHLRAESFWTQVAGVHGDGRVDLPLRPLAVQLDRQRFLRIHRDTVVNRDYMGEMMRHPRGYWVLQVRGRGEALTVGAAFVDRLPPA